MDIKEIFSICNYVLTAVFVLCYIYQFFYIFYVFLGKDRSLPVKSQKQNKFGVVICARNEENVIGNLLDSINRQDYPSELVKIFLVADNCTDNTAQVGRDHGATVIERFNNELVGKGYALDMLFKKLLDEKDDCDVYIIFDADNLVDKNFINLGGNRFLVNTHLTIGEITEKLSITPLRSQNPIRPLLSVVLEHFGTIPDEEDSFMLDGLEITVDKVENQRVSSVIIRLPDESEKDGERE